MLTTIQRFNDTILYRAEALGWATLLVIESGAMAKKTAIPTIQPKGNATSKMQV